MTRGLGNTDSKDGGTLDIDEVEEILERVLTVQRQDEERWRQLALAWSPICDQAVILAKDRPIRETGVGFIIDEALKQI